MYISLHLKRVQGANALQIVKIGQQTTFHIDNKAECSKMTVGYKRIHTGGQGTTESFLNKR